MQRQEATANARKKHLSASTTAWATQNKPRSIYTSDLVQFTVVGIILANFVANIVEFELMSDDPAVIQRFEDMDLTFTILFTLELIANLIANLDLLPFAWMSDSWNVMDLLIVIISLVSLTPTLGSSGGVKAIRVMRAFRVARIFKRLIALRLIVKALADSLIPVMNTFFVMLVSTSGKYPTLFVEKIRRFIFIILENIFIEYKITRFECSVCDSGRCPLQ